MQSIATNEAPSEDRLDFVQALRGIAAAAVVLAHAAVFIDGDSFLHVGSRLFASGAAGVDLFFVISGLIMVHTTRRVAGTARDAVAFVIRRFARIWPVWVVGFFAMWLLTSPLPQAPFVVTWHSFRNSMVFLPQDAHAAAPFFGYPLLHVGWTLTYEIAFYLAFAIAIATGRFRWIALAAIFVGCLIVWPYLATGRIELDATRSYRLDGYPAVATSPIMWDFALGIGIGLLRSSRFVIRDRGLLGCFVALSIGAVVWQLLSGFHKGHGLTNWAIPMAVMVLALTLYDKAFTIRVHPWLRWLGNISFSLYLFHVMPQMVPRLISHPQLMSGGGFFVASITAGVVLAYLANRWLERGLSEWTRRRLLAFVVKRRT